MNNNALTFLFKEIFPTKASWETYFGDYDIVDLTDDNTPFCDYLYKILYRRYANSNVQFDTIEDFKLALANKVEDVFAKYARQLTLIEKVNNLTDDELLRVSSALANSANNPNDAPDDPTQPLNYISAQAYSLVNSNKLTSYLSALNSVSTKLIDAFLTQCASLFKGIFSEEAILFD